MWSAVRTRALWCCALAACANHVRFEESEQRGERRSPLEAHAAVVQPGALLERSQLRLELRRFERAEYVSERRVIRAELATPYQGLRELAEVPAGLLVLPAALARGVADAALLGRLPGPLLGSWAHWSAAALNPLLNAEDPGRVQRRELEEREDPPLRHEEVFEGPLANHLVALSLDGERAWLARTDAAGALEFSLLDQVQALGPSRLPRRVSLRVRDERGAELLRHSFFVERRLARRLARALPAARLARDPATPPELLARALHALGRLGFRAEADGWWAAAQTRLAAQPDALAALQRRVARAARRRQPLDALLATLTAPAGPLPAAPAR
jgi:hypothetical protein